MDLFRSSRPAPTNAPRRTWRSLLPFGESRLGQFLFDPFIMEDFISAFCGDRESKEREFLAGLIATELAEARCLLRVFELIEAAPALIRGTDRLSCRCADIARRALRRKDAIGTEMPFTVVLSKLRRRPEPFAHGLLTFHAGVAMSSVSSNSTFVEEWKGPVPLLIGGSTVHLTWEHLLRSRAVAVWCDTRLWILRADKPFPSAFNQKPADSYGTLSPFEDPQQESRAARRFQPAHGPCDDAEVPATAAEESVPSSEREAEHPRQGQSYDPTNRAALRREE